MLYLKKEFRLAKMQKQAMEALRNLSKEIIPHILKDSKKEKHSNHDKDSEINHKADTLAIIEALQNVVAPLETLEHRLVNKWMI